jgi:GntR family transcriptional regulator, transcriptional repressor for pyruvate dehydrogenase complex
MAERTQFVRMKIPKGSDLLAEQIRSAIMEGELEEGAMLPSEKELMSQMGLSRATVREGLRLLEAQGLISTRPGRGGGATVQRPGHIGHTRSLATLLQLDGVTLNELFEAWSALVPVCGRLAAKHITPAQLDELRRHVDYMAASLDEHSTFTALEVRFHMLIAHATNNAVLRIYHTSLAELTFQQIRDVPFSRPEMEAGLASCRATLEAIRAGDGARAERRIARHLAAVEADIMRLASTLGYRPAEVTGNMNHLTAMSDRS